MDNRLDEASSPYLRQHADNPVAWQPWDEEALALARERDVPIFLSIGYAACHWCHVMEEESFSDPAVAELLNEHFVPIKVDREERPDVDSVYMTVCQLVQGGGGWPLSVWLTPEGDPFRVGTYFPPEPRRGMPAFERVLEDVVDVWTDPEERSELEGRAAQWTEAVAGEVEAAPETPGEPPDERFLDGAAGAAVRSADREHGGWGRRQKFPQPGRIHLLLRAHDRTARDAYREVAVEALDAMASGGLFDHVGGGFHRYCVDREWTVPHFEKMLYDNAELPRAYLAGYRLTGEDRYAAVTRRTLAFLERELSHPEGGFYATLDAESETDDGEREEGAFYVWTPDGVREAVDDTSDAELFCERYGLTEAGNFEGGTTVLTESRSVRTLADGRDLDRETASERLERARRQAFEARAERPRPPRDEKVLAGWNGLAISAFAEAAIALDGDHSEHDDQSDLGDHGEHAEANGYAERAGRALSFCREHLWDADGRRLNRRFMDGDVGIQGYLEDYAFLGRGALDVHQATGELAPLSFALELGRVVREAFYDDEAGTMYFTPTDGESLVARPQELTDSATPSSTGVALQLLSRLAHVAPGEAFDEVVETVVGTHASTLESRPLAHASLVLGADDRAVGPLELTVAADELPPDWRRTIGERYLPTRFLNRRPATEAETAEWAEALGLESVPPIWANREARDGEPTLYACRSFTCSPPTHDVDEALSWLESNAGE